MGGFTNKLPDPSVGLTVFAPTNNALWKLLTAMNLGETPGLGMSAVSFCVLRSWSCATE
jgi:hypothetical protein